MSKFTPISVHDLGDYLKEQRHTAQLSLRQLSEVAGISNPYLSQIERGLKKPSAEILQALAKALRISAESLYVRAGFLEERIGASAPIDVRGAIQADRKLSDRQREVLLDVYESFVGAPAPASASAPRRTASATKTTKISGATKTASPLKAAKASRSTKPRPASRPARHQPPAVNNTKENLS
jgi:transcriptional regulator with XRE-family HTH domain